MTRTRQVETPSSRRKTCRLDLVRVSFCVSLRGHGSASGEGELNERDGMATCPGIIDPCSKGFELLLKV